MILLEHLGLLGGTVFELLALGGLMRDLRLELAEAVFERGVAAAGVVGGAEADCGRKSAGLVGSLGEEGLGMRVRRKQAYSCFA